MPIKGYKHTEEAKKKMSERHKQNPTRYWLGKTNPFFGKHHSEEAKRKVSEANKGRKMPFRTLEYRKRMSEAYKGEKSSNWKGGIAPLNAIIRNSLEYKLWREAVFKRDNWTCVWCGQRGVRLNADHIKPFSLFPELRFAIDNGRTLCVPCHRKTDTWGCKSNKDM